MKDNRKLVQNAANPCRLGRVKAFERWISFWIHNQGGTASKVLVPVGDEGFFYLSKKII